MIPIENLYMMLAYAWNRLDEAKLVDVSGLPQKGFPNLLARVLWSGTTHLIKRGFHKEYDETAEGTALLGHDDPDRAADIVEECVTAPDPLAVRVLISPRTR
jgi:5-methylcytosine-specific restriction enzyme subunit McrC